jgi:hypothetical protein
MPGSAIVLGLAILASTAYGKAYGTAGALPETMPLKPYLVAAPASFDNWLVSFQEIPGKPGLYLVVRDLGDQALYNVAGKRLIRLPHWSPRLTSH